MRLGMLLAILMVAALGLVTLATIAVAALVFLLSAQLRRRETDTMLKIGALGWRIAAILGSEVTFVLLLGVVLAGGLVWTTGRFGPEAIRSLLAH